MSDTRWGSRGRTEKGSQPAMPATHLIPSYLSKLTNEKQEMMLSWYRNDLPQPDSIDQEVHRWKVKKQVLEELESSAIHTLAGLDKDTIQTSTVSSQST